MTCNLSHGGQLRSIAVGLLVLLGACASPAESTHMVVAAAPTGGSFPAPLRHAMCVRNITGGEETNPLWVSKVNNDDFGKALSGSLDASELSAPAGGCKY